MEETEEPTTAQAIQNKYRKQYLKQEQKPAMAYGKPVAPPKPVEPEGEAKEATETFAKQQRTKEAAPRRIQRAKAGGLGTTPPLDLNVELKAKTKAVAARYKQLEEDHPMAVIGSEVALAMANPVLSAGIDSKDLARAWDAVERGEPWAVPLTVLAGLGLASNAVPVFGPLAKGAFKGVWSVAKNAPREVKAVAKGLQQGSEAIGEGTKHGLRALRQLILQKKGKLPPTIAPPTVGDEPYTVAPRQIADPPVASPEVNVPENMTLEEQLSFETKGGERKRLDLEAEEERVKDTGRRRGYGSNTGIQGYDAEQLNVKLRELQTGKATAEFLVKHASDPSYQRIAHRILPFLDDVDVRVVNQGEEMPNIMGQAGGYAAWEADVPGQSIWLHGGPRGAMRSSMDAEVILHELLHAATTGRVNEGLLVANKGTELHNSVIKLTELASAVQGAQRKLQHEGLYSTALHGARGGLESQQADIYLMELMTYGLTNKATQDFLKTIPVPGGTAYEEFVLLVKEVLGLGAEDVDALSRLIQTTDDILASPRAELSSVFEAHPVTPQPKFLSKKDWDAREREGTTEKWLRPHMSKQEWMDTYIPPPPHPYSASSASEVGHQRPPLGSPVQELDVKTATEIKQEARKKAMQKP